MSSLRVAFLVVLSGCYLSHELEDPPVVVPPGVDGGPGVVPPSECPSALRLGAPSPMAGYCPTLANRSEWEAPATQPELAWELELPEEADRFAHLVVGREGRIYVRSSSRIFAVDDRGGRARLRWVKEFDGVPSSPVLLADGSIFVTVRMGLDGSQGLWLDDGGDIERRAPLPEGVGAPPIVGESGRFYFRVPTGEDFQSVLVAWSPTEERELWRTRAIPSSFPKVALGPGDALYVLDPLLAADGRVPRITRFDGATGEAMWSTIVGAPEEPINRGPAVGPDGAVHLVAWTERTTVSTLVSLEPNGDERLRMALPTEPWGGGVAALTIGGDGRLFVKEGEKLMGIEPDGTVAWERRAHPNIAAGETVDAAGRLLAGSGGSSAIDGATGEELWVSDIPAVREMTPGGGVSISFPGPPTLGDGVIYYMASDRILQSAAAP
ncbi:MAG: PQQ-binding-like beta-propeller repeat protein [Deltaproteobacteria bacterium]|nr:PQQ-binding-like beta-propeller repeat protein [Deltaproteobacteria bacterium]